MAQRGKSTVVEDRLPGMEEEVIRRKIPVDHLSNRGHEWAHSFKVHFREDSTKTHRKEFAALRKEFEAYKKSHHVERGNRITGSCWELYPDLLIHFADWMEFLEPLEMLMERAKQEGKARYEREQQEREEQHRKWHQEKRAYRIPCPSPCKVRVSKLECVGGEGPFDDILFEERDKYPLHRFSIQFNEGATKEETDAWRYLAKTLEEDKVNRTTGFSHRTNNIEGYGQHWTLHEYVLLAYSDWLELDGDIETLMAEAVEKRKQEELRWEEIRDRTRYQRSFSPQAETGPSKAFTLFNLDSSATQDDVKKRYRALSKLYHPDTGGDAEQFKRLNQANQVLMEYIG